MRIAIRLGWCPSPAPAVILYDNDRWLREFVLKGLAATTLEVFPKLKIYLTPRIIFGTIVRLCCTRYPRTLRDITRHFIAQHLLAAIDATGARFVVTFIDNSAFFQLMSRLDSRRTYYAIQNGTRTLWCVRDGLQTGDRATISMTNFFCFGQRDIDLYRANGHQIDRFFPVGSLIGGYYRTVVAPRRITPDIDLCYISQWHAHHQRLSAEDSLPNLQARRTAAAIAGLHELLNRLICETGLSLLVCPREGLDSEEVAYFRKLFGDRAQIVSADRENFSTYRSVDRSHIAIALNSTVLLEAFSWGHKVLWCNSTEDEHFSMPEAEICYFTGVDYAAFKARVFDLMTIDSEEFKRRTAEVARYINQFDPTNPPHSAIRATIGV